MKAVEVVGVPEQERAEDPFAPEVLITPEWIHAIENKILRDYEQRMNEGKLYTWKKRRVDDLINYQYIRAYFEDHESSPDFTKRIDAICRQAAVDFMTRLQNDGDDDNKDHHYDMIADKVTVIQLDPSLKDQLPASPKAIESLSVSSYDDSKQMSAEDISFFIDELYRMRLLEVEESLKTEIPEQVYESLSDDPEDFVEEFGPSELCRTLIRLRLLNPQRNPMTESLRKVLNEYRDDWEMETVLYNAALCVLHAETVKIDDSGRVVMTRKSGDLKEGPPLPERSQV